MPTWIAPVVAVALVVIALAAAVVAAMVYGTVMEAKEHGESLAKELARLRADLAPTLDAVKRLGEKGIDVVDLAQDEAKQLIDTTRRLRYDIERGVKRAKRHLADFEAVVEVAQEEIESAVVDVGTALQTARTGAGMIGRLRRLIRPRRRGAA
ncbi:MAG: hypothetical protein ACRELE_01515 [Gemmatimonadales bacterium]